MIFIHVAPQGIPGSAGFATELAVEARVVDVGGLHMPGDVRLAGWDLEAGEAGPLPGPAHHLHLHPLADQRVQVWQHKEDRGVENRFDLQVKFLYGSVDSCKIVQVLAVVHICFRFMLESSICLQSISNIQNFIKAFKILIVTWKTLFAP